jgi:hypothetical protein
MTNSLPLPSSITVTASPPSPSTAVAWAERGAACAHATDVHEPQLAAILAIHLLHLADAVASQERSS